MLAITTVKFNQRIMSILAIFSKISFILKNPNDYCISVVYTRLNFIVQCTISINICSIKLCIGHENWVGSRRLRHPMTILLTVHTITFLRVSSTIFCHHNITFPQFGCLLRKISLVGTPSTMFVVEYLKDNDNDPGTDACQHHYEHT